MRNFSKVGKFIASCIASPLPLSGPALVSQHLRDLTSFFRSLAIVRKSPEALTNPRDA
jgi:hypothetical protein